MIHSPSSTVDRSTFSIGRTQSQQQRQRQYKRSATSWRTAIHPSIHPPRTSPRPISSQSRLSSHSPPPPVHRTVDATPSYLSDSDASSTESLQHQLPHRPIAHRTMVRPTTLAKVRPECPQRLGCRPDPSRLFLALPSPSNRPSLPRRWGSTSPSSREKTAKPPLPSRPSSVCPTATAPRSTRRPANPSPSPRR